MLTPREHEVAIIISQGYSEKEAARVLEMTLSTLKTHKMNIYRKLDVHNGAELTRWVMEGER